MAVPDFQSLMLPLLQEAANGNAKISAIIERLGTKLKLSDEDLTTLLPSGRQTAFANRIYWAKIYLARAGLLDATARGWVQITDEGRRVLQDPPSRIDIRFLQRFPDFAKFRQRNTTAPDNGSGATAHKDDTSSLTPDDTMRAAQKLLEAELGNDLLKRILDAPPAFFERLVIKLLTSMGYGGSTAEAARALGRGGDGGVDGVIDQDALGLDRIYVQAKRYTENAVGAGAIRDFFGALDAFKAAKGLFITTSSFTESAKQTARSMSKRIVLVDGDELTRMMISYGVGCRIEETLYIKRLDEDFFDE